MLVQHTEAYTWQVEVLNNKIGEIRKFEPSLRESRQAIAASNLRCYVSPSPPAPEEPAFESCNVSCRISSTMFTVLASNLGPDVNNAEVSLFENLSDKPQHHVKPDWILSVECN